MSSSFSFRAFALVASLLVISPPIMAESPSSENYRVLSNNNVGLNLTTVDEFLKKGDEYFVKGEFLKAQEEFDKARKTSKQLLKFYRDISNSFKGLDARIPREMDSKGRKAIAALAKSNLRLAALFRKDNKPEIAVPLLVEVLKIMTPANVEGQRAYQLLVELGFANTVYGGARKGS